MEHPIRVESGPPCRRLRVTCADIVFAGSTVFAGSAVPSVVSSAGAAPSSAGKFSASCLDALANMSVTRFCISGSFTLFKKVPADDMSMSYTLAVTSVSDVASGTGSDVASLPITRRAGSWSRFSPCQGAPAHIVPHRLFDVSDMPTSHC